MELIIDPTLEQLEALVPLGVWELDPEDQKIADNVGATLLVVKTLIGLFADEVKPNAHTIYRLIDHNALNAATDGKSNEEIGKLANAAFMEAMSRVDFKTMENYCLSDSYSSILAGMATRKIGDVIGMRQNGILLEAFEAFGDEQDAAEKAAAVAAATAAAATAEPAAAEPAAPVEATAEDMAKAMGEAPAAAAPKGVRGLHEAFMEATQLAAQAVPDKKHIEGIGFMLTRDMISLVSCISHGAVSRSIVRRHPGIRFPIQAHIMWQTSMETGVTVVTILGHRTKDMDHFTHQKPGPGDLADLADLLERLKGKAKASMGEEVCGAGCGHDHGGEFDAGDHGRMVVDLPGAPPGQSEAVAPAAEQAKTTPPFSAAVG